MKIVYSVARGNISEYEITKETNCYYFIENGTYKDKLSKDGFRLQHRLGGRAVVTVDRLEAYNAAQNQINIIDKYLEERRLELAKAEEGLNAFYVNNSNDNN